MAVPSVARMLVRPAAPAFTLGVALGLLGHDCPDECSTLIDALSVTVWFIRHNERFWSVSQEALVVVHVRDSHECPARVHRVIGDINRCVRRDGIRVCERNSPGSTRFRYEWSARHRLPGTGTPATASGHLIGGHLIGRCRGFRGEALASPPRRVRGAIGPRLSHRTHRSNDEQ